MDTYFHQCKAGVLLFIHKLIPVRFCWIAIEIKIYMNDSIYIFKNKTKNMRYNYSSGPWIHGFGTRFLLSNNKLPSMKFW